MKNISTGEKLFFAYIWYDETSEYYYYNDGELIRWIDSMENVTITKKIMKFCETWREILEQFIESIEGEA